jgi:predicted nucleotide-binding protein
LSFADSLLIAWITARHIRDRLRQERTGQSATNHSAKVNRISHVKYWKMTNNELVRRYDAFAKEAEELLTNAGFDREGQKPLITGRSFYDACVALATIHFPEDKEVNGIGPRGLLWGMYGSVDSRYEKSNPIEGARSIALVLKQIIKNRPPLDIEEKQSNIENLKRRNAITQKNKNGKVFIVHGHDNGLKETTSRFCEHIGLNPIVLHEQSNIGLTIIEKFEKHSDVEFTIVLMTGDDIGYPRNEANKANLRSRQNVIFELGYFIGKIGRSKVCALYQEGIEIPSDYQGIIYIPLDKNESWKLKLAKEISDSGITINTAGIIK